MNKLSPIILMLTTSLTMLFPSCADEFSFEPNISDPFLATIDQFDSTQSEDLIIRFNKPVNKTSFDAAFNLIAGFQINQIMTISANKEILIQGNFTDCDGDTLCKIEIFALGDTINGKEAILSMDGQILDGNRDGTDGGDWAESLTFIK